MSPFAHLQTLAEAQRTPRAAKDLQKPRPSLLVKKVKTSQRIKAEAKLRAEVRGRDGNQCQCCHVPVFVAAANPLQRAQVHHIQFRSKGGKNEHKNMITVCAECHAKIHAHEIDVVGTNAMNVRFIRRRGADGQETQRRVG